MAELEHLALDAREVALRLDAAFSSPKYESRTKGFRSAQTLTEGEWRALRAELVRLRPAAPAPAPEALPATAEAGEGATP